MEFLDHVLIYGLACLWCACVRVCLGTMQFLHLSLQPTRPTHYAMRDFYRPVQGLCDRPHGGRHTVELFAFFGVRACVLSFCAKSHFVVYQLFGHATARLLDRSARERAFPLEAGCVYYLPSEVFAQLSFTPVTTGSLTLLLTVLNPVTPRRLVQRVEGPIHGSLSKLQSALSSLQALEQDPDLGATASVSMPAGFGLLTLNVEHTTKTKVRALQQLLQWSGHPAVAFLQETGVLPPHFIFHCLNWHTYTVVCSLSLVRRDS